MDSKAFDYERWLAQFEAGDEAAARQLFDVYYERLVRLARKRLAGMPPQVADEEGAVISALRSFFSGVQDGQFSRIDDDADLWRVLATITARKAVRQMRRHWKKSGEASHVTRNYQLANLFATEPSPQDEAILMESCEKCIDSIEDPILKEVAQYRLEGAETHEIADRLGLHVRSIQRKLKLIESIWLEKMDLE